MKVVKNITLSTICVIGLVACESKSEVEVARLNIMRTPKLTTVGSALDFYRPKKTRRGTQNFYSVSDGGNAPAVLEIRVKKDQSDILDVFPVDTPAKLDLEGVTVGKPKQLWLADGYGPSLLEYNLDTKHVEQILSPAQGLPDILRFIQSDRGFEAVAYANGKVVAPLKSTLNISGKTKLSAQFIRILVFDPISQESFMYAYRVNASVREDRSEVQITDIAWIEGEKFLVLEYTPASSLRAQATNKIIEIDLSGATNIADLKVDSVYPEFIDEEFRLFGSPLSGKGGVIKPVTRNEVFDLATIGWSNVVPEGLTVLDDQQTIAISSAGARNESLLWITKLPSKLVTDWFGRLAWILGIIVMASAVIWALIPSDETINVEVQRLPEDNDVKID